MKISLADVAGQVAAPSLAGLAVYLETEEIQEGVADGPVVEFGLVNGGDAELALLNPFVLIQFELLDHAGFPLNLPGRPPPMLVHNAGGEDWSLDGPIPVVGVLLNGQAADRSSVEGRVFRIAAHDDWRVSFELSRIVTPTVPPAEVLTPDGTYTVGIMATLIDAIDPNRSRILEGGGIVVRFAARRG